MPSDDSRSSHHRTRALDRLRALTVGTTLAGVAATAGFGGLAALTYRGVDDQADTGSTTALVQTPLATPEPTDPAATGTGTPQAPTPTPTPRATHRAHVSSGGSGG